MFNWLRRLFRREEAPTVTAEFILDQCADVANFYPTFNTETPEDYNDMFGVPSGGNVISGDPNPTSVAETRDAWWEMLHSFKQMADPDREGDD